MKLPDRRWYFTRLSLSAAQKKAVMRAYSDATLGVIYARCARDQHAARRYAETARLLIAAFHQPNPHKSKRPALAR